MSGIERRRFSREPLNVPMWLIKDETQTVVRAQTDNLSFGGAQLLLEDASLANAGEDVRVRMVLPDSLGPTNTFCSVDAPAKVAWVRPFAESEHGQVHLGLTFENPIPVPMPSLVG